MDRQPAEDQRRSGRMSHSAFTGCFAVPSIGICRMDYRHSPDVFLLSRVTSRLSQAKIQYLRLGLQSFLQSISVKQSRRTAFNFVFFKHVDSASLADAGPLLQKVLDFRKSLEELRQVLYHGATRGVTEPATKECLIAGALGKPASDQMS